eukprot:TRINITY_DN21809_c0_g1_i1.p1 TRINITY_DN21809_c0_g1~~TRINITY_DN21809_c0_g1_i1.p1  ORF type:complete len:124 (+),score=35.24 TRINITY_DN21809_c0_g1_i1:245-616(+)
MKSKGPEGGRWMMRTTNNKSRLLDKLQDETKKTEEEPLQGALDQDEEIDQEKLPEIEGESKEERRRKLKQKKEKINKSITKKNLMTMMEKERLDQYVVILKILKKRKKENHNKQEKKEKNTSD